MTGTLAEHAAEDAPARSSFWARYGVQLRLIKRWTILLLLTAIAFRETLIQLAVGTLYGGLDGFIWVVPVAAALAAIGVARRDRTELPIHDRQTDVIIGIMTLGLAVMINGILVPRYAFYFHLMRLDVLAMWVFLFGGAVVIFGLRPVMRFILVWAMLALAFALPYNLTVIVFGGGRIGAGLASLHVAGVASAISVGRHWRRAVVGYAFAVCVGGALLVVMIVFFRWAPVPAYQIIPNMVAFSVVSATMYLLARRGRPKRFLERSVAPLATRQMWGALPMVVVTAVILAFIPLPKNNAPLPLRVTGLPADGPLLTADGWHPTGVEDFDWVKRLYGRQAMLTRQTFVADEGNPEWDELSRPRVIVADVISTHLPYTLLVFPVTLLYNLRALRLSAPEPVDLGYGVQGLMYSAVDDELLVTWDALYWSWINEDGVAQSVLAVAVDNHEDDAPMPTPTGGLGPLVSTLFTVLFRGNSAVSDENPEFKDYAMLKSFGHGLVRANLEPLGVRP